MGSTEEIDAAARLFFVNFSEQMKQQYYPNGGRNSSRDDVGLIVAYRDSCVLCPSVMMANFASRANVSTYFYGWGSHTSGALFRAIYEFDHALPHVMEQDAMFGGTGLSGLLDRSLFTKQTAQSVVEYWASFAKNGIPTDKSQGVSW